MLDPVLLDRQGTLEDQVTEPAKVKEEKKKNSFLDVMHNYAFFYIDILFFIEISHHPVTYSICAGTDPGQVKCLFLFGW